SDMQQRKLARLCERNRGELSEPAKFALVGASVRKSIAPDDLYGAEHSGDAASEPNVAVAASADEADQFIIGNGRLFGIVRIEGSACPVASHGASRSPSAALVDGKDVGHVRGRPSRPVNPGSPSAWPLPAS